MSSTRFRTVGASKPGIRFNSEDDLSASTYFSARSEVEEVIQPQPDAIWNDEPPDEPTADEPEEPIILTTGELEEQRKSEEYKTGLFGAMSVIICIVVGAGSRIQHNVI